MTLLVHLRIFMIQNGMENLFVLSVENGLAYVQLYHQNLLSLQKFAQGVVSILVNVFRSHVQFVVIFDFTTLLCPFGEKICFRADFFFMSLDMDELLFSLILN